MEASISEAINAINDYITSLENDKNSLEQKIADANKVKNILINRCR
jgi:hypothetical protein